MGTIEEHGFNKCEPPVCSEDIDITVASVICTEDQVLHIEWTVTDRYGRDIESNIIQWSCENRNFDNTASPENTTQPYKTSFDISSCVGVVYFRVKIRIGTSFFYGDEEVTNNSECLSPSTTAVRASWCGDCADTIITPPSYMLYARTSTVPSYPVYFSYDGLCWYIDDNDTEMSIVDLSEGSILTDIETVYDSCEDCCG
jgi:hypothetical protein